MLIFVFLCRRVSTWSEWKLLWELFQPWLSNQLPKQEEMYLGCHSTRWLSHTGYIWWIQHAEKFRFFKHLRWRFQFKRCASDLEWWFVGFHLRLQWIFFVVRVHNGREYHCKRIPRSLHSHSPVEYVSYRFSLYPFMTFGILSLAGVIFLGTAFVSFLCTIWNNRPLLINWCLIYLLQRSSLPFIHWFNYFAYLFMIVLFNM